MFLIEGEEAYKRSFVLGGSLKNSNFIPPKVNKKYIFRKRVSLKLWQPSKHNLNKNNASVLTQTQANLNKITVITRLK